MERWRLVDSGEGGVNDERGSASFLLGRGGGGALSVVAPMLSSDSYLFVNSKQR